MFYLMMLLHKEINLELIDVSFLGTYSIGATPTSKLEISTVILPFVHREWKLVHMLLTKSSKPLMKRCWSSAKLIFWASHFVASPSYQIDPDWHSGGANRWSSPGFHCCYQSNTNSFVALKWLRFSNCICSLRCDTPLPWTYSIVWRLAGDSVAAHAAQL